MKMLLFDIDGTLLATGGAGKIAFERVFKELFNIPHAWGGVVPDGKTDPAIIDEIAQAKLQRALSAEEESRVQDLYIRYFEEEIHRSAGYRLMHGVTELLGLLHASSDFLVGIASGNYEKTSYLKLARGNIAHFFSFGGYGSDSPKRPALVRKAIERGRAMAGKDIALKDIVVIGDTVHDIEAGKQAGTRTVAVRTGSATHEELEAKHPDAVISGFSDPQEFLAVLA